jgi:DNA invertase Pin-like site-specific DNA recombinase
MKIGYARCSTALQDEEAQIARLKAAGCERIYTDHGVSGMKASRPEWDKLTDPDTGPLRPGDVVVFAKLDRIGRSVKHLMAIADDFAARGVDLQALDQPVDTTTAAGKLFFTILAAFAEFERNLISERTRDGLAVRTARGRNGGRKPKLSPEQQDRVRELYALVDPETQVRKYSGRQLAEMFGVSRDTIYQTLSTAQKDAAKKRRRDRYDRDKRDRQPS